MNAKQNKAKGFTIIEVTLAMLFLSILIMSIASLIIRAAEIYQKGLVMRSVNALGSQIMDDMSRAAFSASTEDYGYVDVDNNGHISAEEQEDAYDKYFISATSGSFQNYGAYCTGSQSYLWNTARTFRDSQIPHIEIEIDGTDESEIDGSGRNNDIKFPRLIRVYDPTKKICSSYEAYNGVWDKNGPKVNVRLPNPFKPGEFLDDSGVDDYVTPIIRENQDNLLLHELIVMPETNNVITRQSFTSINFILGTRDGVNITSRNDYCRGIGNEEAVADEYNSIGFSYCAVNKFNFAIRTGGRIDEKG